MDYEIRFVYGHVEVYDQAGRFRFSADSEREALEELENDAAYQPMAARRNTKNRAACGRPLFNYLGCSGGRRPPLRGHCFLCRENLFSVPVSRRWMLPRCM